MATIRIIVTLKPGVLDAQGQAVRRGLRALGYGAVQDVKMGRYIELTIPDAYPQEEIHQMCDRLLANPLIEEWRLERERIGSGNRESGNGHTRERRGDRRGPAGSGPRTPDIGPRGLH